MKNIHVLPTEKPSRLWTNNLRRRLELDEFIEQHPTNIAKHIYITSDEFIEEGDFGLNLSTKNIVQYDGIKGLDSYYKKIILTTDQYLITDGVQAIDDEFLEWFVKNPSCEFVEIRKYHSGILSDISEITSSLKIIIPKEEPKQETLTYTEAAKKEERIFNSTMMSKQETLEEAAERLFSNFQKENPIIPIPKEDIRPFKLGFIKGAKWQQEQDKNKYSEEDVYHILCEHTAFLFAGGKSTLSEWFEQFKKK
jgi:hypothetical protein